MVESRRCRGVCLLAAAGSLLPVNPVIAGEWQQEFSPYVWAAGMGGTVGIGDVTADVDQSFGSILDSLEMGFMAAYKASKGPWSFEADAIHMALGTTATGARDRRRADIDMDQTTFEADAGYRVSEAVTLLGGLRYLRLDAAVDLTGPLADGSAAGKQDWIDPVVGARLMVPLSSKWTMSLRGDVGGFGIGSEFSWQVLGSLRWEMSDSVGLVAAYRYVSIDYEDGRGAGRFEYDVDSAGPGLGLVVAF